MGFVFGVWFDISALRECSLLLCVQDSSQIYLGSQHILTQATELGGEGGNGKWSPRKNNSGHLRGDAFIFKL